MWWWGLLLLAVSVPLLGEVFGHPYFSALGNAFEHHAFHAATVAVGSAFFWVLMAQDIRRNGVPPRLQGVQRLYRTVRGRGPTVTNH